MTDEILQMMEERRKAKGDGIRYNSIQRQINQEIRTAKEYWLRQQCEEIELLEKKHDLFNMHKKIREAAGIYKSNTVGKLQDKHGKIILQKEDKMQEWKTYITKLFDDNRPRKTPTFENQDKLAITTDEVTKAISQLKDGKSPGPDNIHNEFFKLMDSQSIHWITKVFNEIYDKGLIPQLWLKSTFILLPKIPNTKSCSDFRTISLMSHFLKLFLKIIHQRRYRTCEERINRPQFGFRNVMETREALFSIQVLFQRCRDVDCDIFACFIDYQKAFDNVRHDKLIEILKEIGLKGADLRIISSLYWNQTSNIRVGGEESEDIIIRRGVRQGCVLLPILFNVYADRIFQEPLGTSTSALN